jgi:hypothetical protein
MADNPTLEPPSADPHYLSETEAIAMARGSHTDAPVIARLMTPAEAASLAPRLVAMGVKNPDRKVWIVTVHADAWTRGSAERPAQLVHVYSMVIDAEARFATDIGLGIEALR